MDAKPSSFTLSPPDLQAVWQSLSQNVNIEIMQG